MNNLDLSIMENWLIAFMVRFLALFWPDIFSPSKEFFSLREAGNR